MIVRRSASRSSDCCGLPLVRSFPPPASSSSADATAEHGRVWQGIRARLRLVHRLSARRSKERCAFPNLLSVLFRANLLPFNLRRRCLTGAQIMPHTDCLCAPADPPSELSLSRLSLRYHSSLEDWSGSLCETGRDRCVHTSSVPLPTTVRLIV